MDYAKMSAEDLWADATAFGDNVMPGLGYDEVTLVRITYTGTRPKAEFLGKDDFQDKVDWGKRVQHGSITLTFPLDCTHLKNREQRELEVLCKQQGESTQLAEALTSAAGRRYVQSLVSQRREFAALVDLSDLEPQTEVSS